MTTTESLLKRPRRVYRQKRRILGDRNERAMASVFKHKQDSEPGTALPAGFPFSTKLAAAFYTTVEDIDGANNEELRDEAGLTEREATAVLTALQPLL